MGDDVSTGFQSSLRVFQIVDVEGDAELIFVGLVHSSRIHLGLDLDGQHLSEVIEPNLDQVSLAAGHFLDASRAASGVSGRLWLPGTTQNE